MEGHKMAYFKLQLSYIGWIVVCILTLGIGIFWLQPWMSAASCAFYEDLLEEDKLTQNNEVLVKGIQEISVEDWCQNQHQSSVVDDYAKN